jgi:hypothetical protein
MVPWLKQKKPKFFSWVAYKHDLILPLHCTLLSMGKKHILKIFLPFKLLVRGCKETPWFWATTKSCGLILRSNRWTLARALIGQVCWALSPWNGDPLWRIKLALILIIRNWSICFFLSQPCFVGEPHWRWVRGSTQPMNSSYVLIGFQQIMKTTHNKQKLS